MANKVEKSLVFVLGAAVGAILGFSAGVLTAPKTGADTRKELEKRGKAALKKAIAEKDNTENDRVPETE